MQTIDPAEAARDDATTAYNESADRKALTADYASDDLINAMGRDWILNAAGAPDTSDESWQSHGLPWCERYSRAYGQQLSDLLS